MRSDLQPAPWRPLLTGALAERAWRAIRRIRTDLEARAETAAWLSSLAGWSGVALFFGYLDQADPGTGAGDRALEYLERGIGALGDTERIGLHEGFVGLGWVAEHLFGGPLPAGEEDVGADLAEALYEHVGQSPWRRAVDVINGLAGHAIYALERRPRSRGREVLERVVARLRELAEPGEPGVTWHTGIGLLPPAERVKYPEGNYNLGVAHGVPGVIALLAEIQAAGVEPATVVPLLAGAVDWLLARKLPLEAGSVFPFWIARGVEPASTGTAWCYGDLGVSLALLGAARRVGEVSWELEALAIAQSVASRPLPQSGRSDACICHGAAGNGHLFNRLFQATGDPLFERAALAWFGRTFELEQPDAGIGGFQFWDADPNNELAFLDSPGFLTGSAGVGLALLAATAPVEPLWDRLLATAVPPAPPG